MKTWKATGCVLLAGIFWGSMGLFVRQLNAAGLYAIDVMQLRVLASAIFVGLYLLLFDRQKLRLRPRDIWCFAGSGICSLMLFSWCYFTGMQAASLAVMAVLLYTAPVFVMLMSIVFFREKLTGAKLTALVLCLAGCVLVSGVGSSERLGLRGLLLGLGAGFGYALYSILRRLCDRPRLQLVDDHVLHLRLLLARLRAADRLAPDRRDARRAAAADRVGAGHGAADRLSGLYPLHEGPRGHAVEPGLLSSPRSSRSRRPSSARSSSMSRSAWRRSAGSFWFWAGSRY